MSAWATVLLASAIAYALKLLGYVVPHRLLEAPRVRAVTGLLPVALLAALVGVQTFIAAGDSGGHVVLGSRAVAVAVVLIALWLRASFVVVVVLGALTAALLRLAGWS